MSKNSPAGAAYLSSCQREQTDCALELLNALNHNDREALLNNRARPLSDADVTCIADALRSKHSLRILNLEDNAFGVHGVQALFDALAVNPGCLKELRLGKNRLKDPSAVVIGNALALNGFGLKVLDLSENSVTKLGIAPLCQAISSKFCDLVELSLHNNSLEADAAVPIAQALRLSSKLKHFHLGYNSLRDSGAIQIARSLPIAASLATLDLTANRIGPQGGQELAKALLSPNCTLQRLNLRHNNFDDETFEAFGDVIVRNVSLTQLFLGFMKPSTETAMRVLSTLQYNRTLILFDAYGWTLDGADTPRLLEGILDTNPTLRALITDGCFNVMRHVDQCNERREDSRLHRVYVGPEDRLAYQAAAAAKSSFERGRGSMATDRGTPEPPPYTSSRQSSARGPTTTTYPPASRATGSTTPTSQQVTPIVHTGTYDKDIDVLIQELQDVHMDAELRRKLSLIISQLQLKIETLRAFQQQQIISLEERVRSLEQRPCQHTCNGTVVGGVATTPAPLSKAPSTRDPSPSVRINSGNGSEAQQPIAIRPPATRPNDSNAKALSPPQSNLDPVPRESPPPPSPQRLQSPQRGPGGTNTETNALNNSKEIPPGPHTRPLTPQARVADSSTPSGGILQRTLSPPPRTKSPVVVIDQQSSNPPPVIPRNGVPPLPLAQLSRSRTSGTTSPQRSSSTPTFGGVAAADSNAHRSSSTATLTELYVPPTTHSNMASQPAEPSPLLERSPVNPHLQSSQPTPKNTLLEASPGKQARVGRKAPPAALN